MNLTAGIPYYIALYQVSSGTNVQAHLGFQAKCNYGANFLTEESITKMQLVHRFSSKLLIYLVNYFFSRVNLLFFVV